jgi:hypothetical protein
MYFKSCKRIIRKGLVSKSHVWQYQVVLLCKLSYFSIFFPGHESFLFVIGELALFRNSFERSKSSSVSLTVFFF